MAIPAHAGGISPDTERSRPDPSFRINQTLRNLVRDVPAAKAGVIIEKNDRIDARTSFDAPKLIAALEGYIAAHTPEPTVSAALRSHQPEIRGSGVCILADNQLQLDKLESLRIHLQNVLIRTLDNGAVSLSFRIFDSQTSKEEKKLFTAGEKFEYFLKLNPAVSDLKTIFGLELE